LRYAGTTDGQPMMLNGSLHDDIYAAMRQALIAGELVPGQAFSMRTLADQFGTSLIPVRDALKRLVAERGLAVLPNRTVCVPLMGRKRFQELLQVRLSLEPSLARRAAELISHQGITALDKINEEMQAAVGRDDVKAYLGANYCFHFQLYAAAQSTVALPIVESLWMQVGPFLNGVFMERGTANAKDNHAEVLKALRRRDAMGAAAAIARDLTDAADVILAAVEFVTDGEAADAGGGPADKLESRTARPFSRLATSREAG
jgi:DNA-binding GntR family transcriptional regulator